MISTLVVFSGCKKDDASADSGNNNGGGSTTTYAVGDYYNVDGVKGIVYRISDGGKHGKIISLDEAILQWSTEEVLTGATDLYNGESNTNVIISNFDLNNYPAFKWCNNKNTAGISGWYMPSISEVEDIWRVREILDEGLLNNGGVVMHNPWSSTEKDNQTAYCDFLSSYTGKWIGKFVRAVHSF